MKNNHMTKLFSLVLCVVLVAAVALTGCGNKETPAETTAETTAAAAETTESVAETAADETTAAAEAADVTVLGEGATAFNFAVTDKDGNETKYEINTDKKTVGEALLDVKLVEGTVGEYGLMVDTVNGQKLDFNADGMYWAFFIDGEYAQTGVDSTDITAGTNYSMVATKG